ncbi:MAG TPA: hypothetical protein VHH15_03390, partial [Actinophytocola sp.]|nr:hypothetical protein [Actinophytocola sp.]
TEADSVLASADALRARAAELLRSSTAPESEGVRTLPAPDARILPVPEPRGSAGGPDGRDVADSFSGHLEYLSRLARDLGVPDPVEEYFAPVVGRWSDLHAEADRWRLVGDAAREVTESLDRPLGRLDAGWDGEAADSFIAYMQKVGLAGQDLTDAMLGLADVLDVTADGIREIVLQLASVLGETAESASQAMVVPAQGDERTRQYLDLMRRPTKELFEAVRQILEAFVQLCEGIDGSQAFEQFRLEHTFPAENWTFEEPKPPAEPKPDPSTEPSATGGGGGGIGGGGAAGFGGGGAGVSGGGPSTPSGPGGYTYATEQLPTAKPEPVTATTSSSGGGGGAGRPMGGMMPMGMMGAMGQNGQDGDHQSRSRVVADPVDIFGQPEKASAPIIGADDE